MERQALEAYRAAAAVQVKDICSKYGFYGNVEYYEPSPIPGSRRNRLYMVAGINPVYDTASSVRRHSPEEILRKLERNDDLFYPGAFVYDLTEAPDEMQAKHDLIEYCNKAKSICNLYAEYGLQPPERLRLSEVNQLISARDKLDNPLANASLKRKCRADLDWFFKRERSKGFRRRWLDYFRSGKFPTDKGPVAKLNGYFKRNNNRVEMDLLSDGTGEIRKLQMQEYEFKIFEKFIRDCHPDVIYAAGAKEVVDQGLIGKGLQEDSPFGRPVTGEEYSVIRKEKFASEGWDALANLTPAYWEFRDVYFKAADEALVASVYNSIRLQYAKSTPLSELKSRGPLCMQKVPVADFMNFVSLAKANNLRFYIDNLGEYEVPSIKTVNVLYNEHQKGKMEGVIDRMMEDKENFMIEPQINPSLSSMIQHYNGISRAESMKKTRKSSPKALE